MTRLIRSLRRRLRRLLQPERAALADLRAIFDAPWYVAEYRDLSGASGDLFGDFVRHGIAEGRRPNRFFDPAWYGAQNPDAAPRPPLVHYALHGRAARLDPGPRFSAAGYLAAHEDVARTGMDPLEHYLKFGRKEGRRIVRSRQAGRSAGTLDLAEVTAEDLDLPLGIEETALRLATRFQARGATASPR